MRLPPANKRLFAFSDKKNSCLKLYHEDDRTCLVTFTYNNTFSVVNISYKNECWKPVSATTVGALVVAIILGFGILGIVVFKVRLKRAERREFAEFQSKLQYERKSENPLYNSPITEYRVPLEMKTFKEKDT